MAAAVLSVAAAVCARSDEIDHEAVRWCLRNWEPIVEQLMPVPLAKDLALPGSVKWRVVARAKDHIDEFWFDLSAFADGTFRVEGLNPAGGSILQQLRDIYREAPGPLSAAHLLSMTRRSSSSSDCRRLASAARWIERKGSGLSLEPRYSTHAVRYDLSFRTSGPLLDGSTLGHGVGAKVQPN
jgi:hypothetical protein